jgi:3-oxoacyl-[acyl-carrier protein] reductase
MQINLKHKHALVTGASRGIGRAIALELAGCGARVAVHYHENQNRARKVAELLGARAELFQADFNEPMEVSSLFYNVLRKLQHIDILVNNAGVALHSDPAGNDLQWMDDWLRTMEVNLNAAGFLCKKAIEHFLTRGGGIIINIASRAAFRGDTQDYLAYAASKGGLVSLTRSIARSFGKQGVVAFAVAPGFVNTDMAQPFTEAYGEDYAVRDIALAELTEPEDVARMVAFLASGMANQATGSVFDINAGSYMR